MLLAQAVWLQSADDDLLNNYKKERRKKIRMDISKGQLEEVYIINQLGIHPTAEKLGATVQEIRNLLKFYGIKTLRNNYGNKYPEETFNKLNNANWLKEQYIIKNRTCREIGEEIRVSHATIHERVVKLGLKKQRRILPEIRKKLQDREFIIHEYEIKKALGVL